MSPLDDVFRDGLGDRRPDLPPDLWDKIKARKAPLPGGEALDQLFAAPLRERKAAVPTDMWSRIAAARQPAAYRRYAAVLLLLLLVGGGVVGTVYYRGSTSQATTDANLGQGQPSVPIAITPVPETSPAIADRTMLRTNRAAAIAERDPSLAVEEPPRERSTPIATTAEIDLLPINPLRLTTAAAAIPLLPIELLAITDKPLASGAATYTERSITSSRKRPRVELLAGAAYAHQSFGLQGEGAQALRDAREVSEFPEVSYQFTARVHYPVRGRLGLLAGLTYLEIRNQLEYEAGGPGGRELVRTNNRFRMLELPLLATYQLPGRKLRLAVNAGAVFNVTTAASGQFLDPMFSAPRSLKEAGGYRGNVGLGWTASLTTTYLVGKQGTTQLLLEPFFKHYPTSFTGTGAMLSERYWLAGLQLGLRKSF